MHAVFNHIVARLAFGMQALAFCWPASAHAHCDVLPGLGPLLQLSVQLAEPGEGTTDRAATDSAAKVPQAASLVAALEANLVSPRFQGSDHRDVQAAVTVFLQNMQFFIRLAASGKTEQAAGHLRSAPFAATRRAAYFAYRALCHDLEDETLLPPFPQDMPAPATDDAHPTLGTGINTNAPMPKASQHWGQLLIALWGLCVFGVVGLHYALIARTSGKLMRHYCKVPAVLHIAAQDMTGHVVLMGCRGARFETDDDTSRAAVEGFGAGMFCDITVGVQTIAAKTMDDATSRVSMLFVTPLEKDRIKALLALSLTPPKRDRLGRTDAPATRYRFGKGHIPDSLPENTPDSPPDGLPDGLPDGTAPGDAGK